MAQKFKAKTLISNSGVFNNELTAPNLVYNTGNQTISGVKAFDSRPTVNGTGVLLSGEAAQVDLSSTVRTTGNQNISGQKRFVEEDIILLAGSFSINYPSTFVGGFSGPGVYRFVAVPEYRTLIFPNPNYYYSGLNTVGANHVQIYFNAETSRWWYTYNNNLQDASPIVTPTSFAAKLPLNNWSGGNMRIYPTYSHNISHYLGGNDPIDPNLINAVALTGNQRISGVKTFDSSPIISNFFQQGGTAGYVGRLSDGSLSLYASGQDTTVPAFYGWDGFQNTSFQAAAARTNLGLTSTAIAAESSFVRNTGDQNISGVKTFTTGIDIQNSSIPQTLRVFNSTGTNSGEFGIFSWTGNELRIGSTQTNSGLLRDVLLTGRNININASGALNIFDPVNISGNLNLTGNLNVSGTGFFSGIDLNNIDNLTLSGVDIIITGSTLNAYNRIFISGNPVLTGVDLSSYATISQLISTGSRVDSLSGQVVFITGDQTINGNKTFNGSIINSGIADIFPVSETKRRYSPEGLMTTTSTSMQSGYFQYFPFFVKKDAVNPKICVEVTSVNNATPIRYGIYSGNNGFEGAKLFFSGFIDCQNALGVYTGDINTTLKKGPYIIATANTGLSTASACSFRVVSVNANRSLFGDPTGNSTL